MIYLDNAATTFPKPEYVYKAVDEAQRILAVNAGRGTYQASRNAAALLTSVREKLALLVGCSFSERVVLSPSATIAMNQIIHGLQWSKLSNVYVTPFEHNAVIRVLKQISDRYGFEIRLLPFDGVTQKLNETEMQNQFALYHPDVVFVNHISNVTGVILPVQKIFESAKQYCAVTVLDASQSLGLISCDIRQMPVDFLVFAGHKNLYGHIGIGGFIQCSQIKLNPFLAGGTGSDSLNPDMPEELPQRYEAGSHDILSAASLNASLDWLRDVKQNHICQHKKELTSYLIDELRNIRQIMLYLPEDTGQHISIVSLTHKEYLPHELAEILDMDYDIAVRSGYHCAPYVHRLIGTEKGGTLRVSVGYFTEKSEIDKLVYALKELSS